jgi:hypothetical protein
MTLIGNLYLPSSSERAACLPVGRGEVVLKTIKPDYSGFIV